MWNLIQPLLSTIELTYSPRVANSSAPSSEATKMTVSARKHPKPCTYFEFPYLSTCPSQELPYLWIRKSFYRPIGQKRPLDKADDIQRIAPSDIKLPASLIDCQLIGLNLNLHLSRTITIHVLDFQKLTKTNYLSTNV